MIASNNWSINHTFTTRQRDGRHLMVFDGLSENHHGNI